MDDYGNGTVTGIADVSADSGRLSLLDTLRSSFVIQASKLSRSTSADLRTVSIHMNEHESFSDSIYEEQTHLAERELSSFIAAVTELYGPEQARLSEKDWLDESELMDSPPLSTSREWRAVTIAASARLAGRLSTIPHHARAPVASTDTKV